jgi:dihydrofolate reductase
MAGTRRMVLFSNVSLDGFIAGPDGSFDFVIADEELHEVAADMLRESDLVVYGRKTYEIMAGFWPLVPKDPESPAFMVSFADTLNPMKKVVFSRSLKSAGWNTTIKGEIDPQDIRAMKSLPGKSIAVGGANIAQQLIRHGLVDEFKLLIHPVILGGGKPLFGDVPVRLELLRTHTLRSGVVFLHYRKTSVP